MRIDLAAETADALGGIEVPALALEINLWLGGGFCEREGRVA
jgi:hypothetical protein